MPVWNCPRNVGNFTCGPKAVIEVSEKPLYRPPLRRCSISTIPSTIATVLYQHDSLYSRSVRRRKWTRMWATTDSSRIAEWHLSPASSSGFRDVIFRCW